MVRRGEPAVIKRLSRIALLSSLAVVLRLAFATLPNIQPITALFLIILEWLGLGSAVLVMLVTVLVTSFLLGFGPWVLGQILAYGLVLLVAHLTLARLKFLLWRSVLAAALSLLYGWFMSVYSAPFFQMAIWAYWLNGLTFDVLHALSSAFFYPYLYHIFRRMIREKILD